MLLATPITALIAGMMIACTQEDDQGEGSSSTNPPNGSSNSKVADLTNPQIESICDEYTLDMMSFMARMGCYYTATEGASCEGEIEACVAGLSVELSRTAPCEPDAPAGTPSCYDECVTNIKAQRDLSCQAPINNMNACFDAQFAYLTPTAASVCDGSFFRSLFGDAPPLAECQTLEMLCPNPDQGEEGGEEYGGEYAGSEYGGYEYGGYEYGGESYTGGYSGGYTAGTPGETFNDHIIRISDATGIDDDGGIPGADICEIDIVCDGVSLDANNILSVRLDISTPDCSASQGGACICAGTPRDSDPSCGTNDRSDNAPASNGDTVRGLVYDGTYCPDTRADDAWVSLGAFGSIIIEVADDVDLANCTVTVDELDADEELNIEFCDINMEYCHF